MSAGKWAQRQVWGGGLLAQWPVRRKVAAVLVVPLLATLALGTVGGVDKFQDAQREAAVARNIDTVGPVLELSVATATLSFLQGSGMQDPAAVDNAISNLKQRIADVEYLAGDPDVPAGQENFAKIMASARDTLAKGKGPEPSLPKVKENADNARTTTMKYIEAVIFTVSESVAEAKFRLIDAQNCNGTMILEAIGMLAIGKGEKNGRATFVTGLNGERLMLEVLARRYPPNAQIITDLNLGINNRIQLAAQPGNFPAIQALSSFQESNNAYVGIVNESVKTIRDAAHAKASDTRNAAIGYAVAVGIITLLALGLAALVGLSLTGPLGRLRAAALHVSGRGLPEAVDEIKDGASLDEVRLPAMPVHTDEEIGQLARAVDSMQDQALHLAGEQAQLRVQINDMFETLARRNRSLIDHQLSVIDSLESAPVDPAVQERLYRLDHLAARMRRNAENLLVLAGTQVRRAHTAPVEIADVLWAAVSEVENYQQIELITVPAGQFLEPAATDLAHVTAELLDNAVRASPPDSPVRVAVTRGSQGVLIEVIDHGIGIPPADLDLINERFSTSTEVDASTARHMGLYVVGRLADRHGLTVELRPTTPGARNPGITVSIKVPAALLAGAPQPGRPLPSPVPPAPRPPAPKPAPAQASSSSAPPRIAATPKVSWTPEGTMIATVDPVSLFNSGSQPQVPAPEPVPQPVARPPLPTREPRSGQSLMGPPAPAPGPSLTGPPPGPAAPVSRPPARPPLPQRQRPPAPPQPTWHDPTPSVPLTTPSGEDTAQTPIFAGLVTGWLAEPEAGADDAFASPADAGWAAAAGGAATPARTTAGLPQRRPGERLIPGNASQPGRHRQRRDPDSVRQSLGSHQQGVRDARAARHQADPGR